MSQPSPQDPRFEQPAVSDAAMLEAHEHALLDKVDDGGVYKLLPLVLLFTFSALIFFGGTYLNRFSGHFSPVVFDERAKAPTGPGETVKLDPIVYGKKQFESLCITCHQAVTKSASRATLSLPAMLDCVGCHEAGRRLGAQFQMSNCALCHVDHLQGSLPASHNGNVRPSHNQGFRVLHQDQAAASMRMFRLPQQRYAELSDLRFARTEVGNRGAQR